MRNKLFYDKNIKKYTTMKNTVMLGVPENNFIYNFKNNLFNESDFFNDLPKKSGFESIGFIVKIANNNKEFEDLCGQDKYNSVWGDVYAKMGYILSSFNKNTVSLNPHKSDNFRLLVGAFYFHNSQVVRKEFNRSFSREELTFLTKAIEYNSIHAIQEYNSYLYKEMLSDEYDYDYRKNLAETAINNCKKMLKTYGSYAYMMLAESFFNYAKLNLEKKDFEHATHAIDSAKKSCDIADKYFSKFPSEIQNSIHNASLGRGLKYSNSLRIDSPREAKQMLVDWFDSQLRFIPNPNVVI